MNGPVGDPGEGLQQAYADTLYKLLRVANTPGLRYGAQERNPSPDERRQLDRRVSEAEEERSRLKAQLTALSNQRRAV